jgi:Tfp pilus assembly protein FimT
MQNANLQRKLRKSNIETFIKNWKLKTDNSTRSVTGVTLLELLLVIAVILIIGTLSAPFYSRFIVQNSVTDTSDKLVGSLRKAQTYSMTGKRNGSWGVRFTSSPRQVVLFLQGSSSFNEVYPIPASVSVSGLTQDITFTKAGVPSSGATITISGGNTQETVTLNSEGMVEQQ